MRAKTTFVVAVVVCGAALVVGFCGCGTGPIEQSYAIQSGAQPVSRAAVVEARAAEKTDEPELIDLMKELRTANLNLVDRLTAGSPDQVVRAAVQVSLIARQVSTFEPAIATEGREEAAAFKRLAHQVQDMAVEAAKAVDTGNLSQADQYYVRLHLTCNQCHRLFRGAAAATEPMPIPELETPTPPEVPPESGTDAPPGPIPIPEPGPGPAPPPAPGPAPEPAPRPPE